MVTFLDGPANGQSLLLRRAPIYLRVVRDPVAAKWDALDQPEDEPAAGEEIYVYRRVGDGSTVFVDYRGKHKHLSGRYVMASYKHLPDVDGEQLSETAAWRAWALSQPEARPERSDFEPAGR